MGDRLFAWFGDEGVRQAAYAIVVALLGLISGRLISRRLPAGRLSPQHHLVLRRALGYSVMLLCFSWSLRVLGVSVGALVGAAGILTVAVGFAAQTSTSNLISGLFLMGEQPFVIGDVVMVDGTSGEVVSIDLLSVKLRTFDNLLVRIPNEMMLKSKVINVTHFPIRRLDMEMGIAYKEDFQRVQKVLLKAAEQVAVCLEEPAPRVFFKGFGESAQTIQLSVWSARTNYLALRDKVYREVKLAFDQAGIEIAFPQRVLHIDGASAAHPLAPQAPPVAAPGPLGEVAPTGVPSEGLGPAEGSESRPKAGS